MENLLRILVIGASESNRRRPPSHGEERNQAWAMELEHRNEVLGYWSTFLMHGIDARSSGKSPPDKNILRNFGRGQYLYDRRFIYQWQFAKLWNIAMPASVARFGLYYITAHRNKLRLYAPDVIILCLGSVDCLELSPGRTYDDIIEIGEVDNTKQGFPLKFDYCKSAEEFYELSKQIAEAVTWIGMGKTVLYLDILAGINKSLAYKKRVHDYSCVIQNICKEYNFHHIPYKFMENCNGSEIYQWLRKDDSHPTDLMNATLANVLLDYIPCLSSQNSNIKKDPVPIIKVSDWEEEVSR